MRKKLINKLIQTSFTNNDLNEKNVYIISDNLSQNELKQYLKALKNEIKKRSVYIDLPFSESNNNLKELNNIFPNKKIVIRKNPSLLLGIRVTNNDDIIEMNLKSQFDDIIEHIGNK